MKLQKKDKLRLKMLSKIYKDDTIKKIRGFLMEGYDLESAINRGQNERRN